MRKYLILILTALLLWPVIPAMFYMPVYLFREHSLYVPEEISRMWRQEAVKLDGASRDKIQERLDKLNEDYPDAEMFWVDPSGKKYAVMDRPSDIPEQWTYEDALSFWAQHREHETFAVSSLIGNDPKQGVMVIQLPESHILSAEMTLSRNALLVLLFFVIYLSFFVLSWHFFVRLRRRLIRLQSAMTVNRLKDIPDEVTISKDDEIGELEGAFNRMVRELKDSRNRERKEEELRKQLISNISHDLRTPLTVIRQHTHTVRKAPASSQGQASLDVIDHKLEEVSKLMDNLLSYTLLSAGKYPLHVQTIDIAEEIRNRVAEWYPVFESKGFEVLVELPERPLRWVADPLWFNRILDNVFQNVVRHAGKGRYIAIKIVELKGQSMLVIQDKGPGTSGESPEKGAGIGLSIISMMAREMGMQWELESCANGSSFYIWPEKKLQRGHLR
ncbi:HAMP domain-containing sensor histidine kinase [Paenibacillus mendelii]|uniref:histidine kinase n=1 Tax=Paenibacillus mendelii TaxID=206163 RepID=A0ABV6JLT8_9BACL|nr:HAMP domain-containing sensor histidine kinase [Paenibacillus mendelii]MCQ6562341.1 HAMP domain-containing histidine kinase [Paenibacillus mendelii]